MSLPVIDLAHLDDPAKRTQLLEDLKDGLFRIGFLYLINHGAEKQADAILEYAPKLFEVPTEEKLRVGMVNNPHFVGYTQLGAEKTLKKTDLREQFDFGNADDFSFKEGEPEWKKLHGPTQYVSDQYLPGFEAAVKNYFAALEDVSTRVLHLVAESLSLEPTQFDKFKGKMNRAKIIKYPGPSPDLAPELQTTQGVGAHKDSSGMFTYVLQDTHPGLQVLNWDGNWINADPVKGSLVVNIAQGFEALTGGRCTATTHRVIAPRPGATRYSIPFFQGVKLDLTPAEIEEQTRLISGVISEKPLDLLRRERGTSSEFLDPKYKCFGEAHLRNRIISHSDVAERWYPQLRAKYLAELI